MNIENPVIKILNNLIYKAIETDSSDIHLEPTKKELNVRYRIDGILYQKESIDQEYGLQVISRIKVLAYMNVAERRIPQDGKFIFNFKNQEIDLRIATFPCVWGEKVVIRILDKKHDTINLDNLGLDNVMLDQIKNISKKSSGFFLVTGPTGSGKTTTLHSMLKYLNSNEKNISTLEDPIEYLVAGVNQSQIFSEIGFTFQKGIRSILRLDPDVIMVGEIRDPETAQVAIQAALTGHLVLSTLHTNDSPGALMRLLDMKIEPFLINASLTGILAQRLARKLCEFCKYKSDMNQEEEIFINLHKLPINILYKSSGCDKCNNLGYKGRIGIFELLILSNSLKNLIRKNPIFNDVYSQAISDGMIPLIQDAANKVNSGIISLYELARVII